MTVHIDDAVAIMENSKICYLCVFVQEEQGNRITTPYGRLKSGGEKRHGKVSSVFVNPLRGRVLSVGGRRSNPSSCSSRQHQQLLQLQLAGPIVDTPYDAVLLDNEDVAL